MTSGEFHSILSSEAWVKHAICLVGEAWGAEEERQRMPFVGASGWHLTQMLEEAGIARSECFLTNVFNLRPPGGNDVENLCGDKDRAIVGRGPLRPGKYVKAEYASELLRLQEELRGVRPNLIIGLGNTASWAIIGAVGISKIRGTVVDSPFGKFIPTYHPAAILRDWTLRPVTVLDLRKAAREAAFPEVRRPQREIWIEPTLDDLEVFYEKHIKSCSLLAFDIETAGTEITCIGFAPNERVALVIPFTDPRRAGGSYWPSKDDEKRSWQFVRRVLSTPIPKLAQNGAYDYHFLWKQYGIAPVNFAHDTMLLHHSLYPESEKGLGFLGSVYTNEASWKLMRSRGKTTIKRDE
jgi:uracil-DNA glycosylase